MSVLLRYQCYYWCLAVVCKSVSLVHHFLFSFYAVSLHQAQLFFSSRIIVEIRQIVCTSQKRMGFFFFQFLFPFSFHLSVCVGAGITLYHFRGQEGLVEITLCHLKGGEEREDCL